MTTADRIRNRRMELGLTQLEIAKKLGLTTKAAVSKIENKGDNIKLSTIEKYAVVLDCTPAYLMGWDESKEKEREEERIKQFIRLYSYLPEEQKQLIDNMLITLTSKK